MKTSDPTPIGLTKSLCPECLAVVPAEIVDRTGRVYFRKRCPTHGVREDFVSGDAAWFDRHVSQAPGKVPLRHAVEPRLGCPLDCGMCTEHQQHTCLALLEITSSCNLKCPMCFASSAPGGVHLSLEDCRRAIDHLVAAEGEPEVLQLSGGEPTIHPRVLDVVDYACRQPIDVVMINTNGVRLGRDPAFVDALAEHRDRVEVYLQFDGFDDRCYRSLRGADLLATKLAAIEACGAAGINMTLVATLEAGVNFSDAALAELVDFAAERPWIAGVSLQPATYVGRCPEPATLESRVTLPDAIHAIDRGTGGRLAESDFTPLPCAHPNAHAIAYAYRSAGRVTPLARLIDLAEHIDLLSGRITYTRPRARRLIEEFLSRQCCPDGSCGVPTFGVPEDAEASRPPGRQPNGFAALPIVDPKPAAAPAANAGQGGTHAQAGAACAVDAAARSELGAIGAEFVERALAERLNPSDVFRVTITSFMDAYNFDLRQLMRSCVSFVLPSGHLIPFSAYNVLYREGHVALPPVAASVGEATGRTKPAAVAASGVAAGAG